LTLAEGIFACPGSREPGLLRIFFITTNKRVWLWRIFTKAHATRPLGNGIFSLTTGEKGL